MWNNTNTSTDIISKVEGRQWIFAQTIQDFR
jgi:hypothetical protein